MTNKILVFDINRLQGYSSFMGFLKKEEKKKKRKKNICMGMGLWVGPGYILVELISRKAHCELRWGGPTAWPCRDYLVLTKSD